MKKKAVIAHIYMAGKRPVDVAAELKVSKAAVSKVINGRGKSRRIEEFISRLTGIPRSQLWPNSASRRRTRRAAA